MLIRIDKGSYDSANASHETKKHLFQLLKIEAEQFIEIKSEKLFAEDPIGYFNATFLAKVSSANPMKLSVSKYLELMGLSDWQFIQAAREFNKCNGSLEAPNIKDFEVHTSSRAEEERLTKVNNLLKAFSDLGIDIRPCARHLQGVVSYDFLGGGNIVPNETFIKRN